MNRILPYRLSTYRADLTFFQALSSPTFFTNTLIRKKSATPPKLYNQPLRWQRATTDYYACRHNKKQRLLSTSYVSYIQALRGRKALSPPLHLASEPALIEFSPQKDRKPLSMPAMYDEICQSRFDSEASERLDLPPGTLWPTLTAALLVVGIAGRGNCGLPDQRLLRPPGLPHFHVING